MANISEHIRQAKNNIDFLLNVNSLIINSWDWQVTVSFYVAVHLMNARIAAIENHHYRSHEKVNNALNPFSGKSTALPEDEYTAYMILQNLSRRARYLCHHTGGIPNEKAFFTDVNHFVRAIRQLDKLMQYMHLTHNVEFPKIKISCSKTVVPLIYFILS